MATNISVKTLLRCLPDSLLERLSIEYAVNKQVKKLEGKIVFKLFLYDVLSSSNSSLNVLISLLDKMVFRSSIGVKKDFTIKRKSLIDSVISLNNDFLKSLFKEFVKILLNIYQADKSMVTRFIL
jgi:hypothetical protein